jgi:hypothetical protein
MKGSNEMKKAILAIVVATTGCGLFETDDGSDEVESVTLSAMNNSGQTGTAILTDLGNTTTQVAITTTGGTDTGVQSAVARTGSCGSNGAIYAQLNNIQGRQSITTLQQALSSLKGGKYYIDVHSSSSVDDIVSCGSIK